MKEMSLVEFLEMKREFNKTTADVLLETESGAWFLARQYGRFDDLDHEHIMDKFISGGYARILAENLRGMDGVDNTACSGAIAGLPDGPGLILEFRDNFTGFGGSAVFVFMEPELVDWFLDNIDIFHDMDAMVAARLIALGHYNSVREHSRKFRMSDETRQVIHLLGKCFPTQEGEQNDAR